MKGRFAWRTTINLSRETSLPEARSVISMCYWCTTIYSSENISCDVCVGFGSLAQCEVITVHSWGISAAFCPTWYPVSLSSLIQEKNWCGGRATCSQWSLGCSGRCHKPQRTGSRWAAASGAWRVSRSPPEAPSDACKQEKAVKQENGCTYRCTNAQMYSLKTLRSGGPQHEEDEQTHLCV